MHGLAKELRLGWMALVLAAGAVGQDLPPASTPPPNLLDSLSMDPARRAALATKIGERNYGAAEELLAEEAKREPKSQPILLALANVLFLDGKHLNCAVALKKAEKIAPLDERSRLLLGLSYVTIGRLNWARPEFESLAKSFPRNAVYPYWLARIAYRKMEIDSAIVHAQKAIQLDPAFMKAYDQLGLCYAAEGKSDQAIQAFQEAIRLNLQSSAGSPWPAMNLGVLWLRLERLDEAEAQLRDSIGIDGRFPAAHYRLGQVLERKERYEEAVRELEQAANLDPTYPEPHYALARIFRKRGSAERADRELNAFREVRETDKKKGITRPD